MTLADLCDLIMVINLPERSDRLRLVQQELQQLGLSWQAGKLERFNAIRPDDAAGFPSIGTRGCFLSHLAVLREAHKRQVQRVLVLEDDCMPAPLLQSYLPALASALQQAPAFLYLGICSIQGQRARHEPFALTDAPLVGAHAYIVDRSVLPALIDYLQGCLEREPGHPLGSPMHFDGALTLFRRFHPQWQTRLAAEDLFVQRSSRSDIQPWRWYDRLPLVRQLSNQLRYYKQHLKTLSDRLRQSPQ